MSTNLTTDSVTVGASQQKRGTSLKDKAIAVGVGAATGGSAKLISDAIFNYKAKPFVSDLKLRSLNQTIIDSESGRISLEQRVKDLVANAEGRHTPLSDGRMTIPGSITDMYEHYYPFNQNRSLRMNNNSLAEQKVLITNAIDKEIQEIKNQTNIAKETLQKAEERMPLKKLQQKILNIKACKGLVGIGVALFAGVAGAIAYTAKA